MTLEEILAGARAIGAAEDELLRIASELDAIFVSRMPFDLLLSEAVETIRHGLHHHPSVQRIIDLRRKDGMPDELVEVLS